jgi:hypothetical protein
MGKASSSKKVARAARAGGRTTKGPKRNLGYPLAIAAIVVVGVLVVLIARNDQQEAAATTPTVEDHWHAAYGIYVCDAFLPPLTDTVQDPTGLHTHGDGIAHLHPFNSAAAGDNATLAKWGATTGLSFSDHGFTVGDTTYDDGFECSGQPAEVSLNVWSADDTSAEPRVYTGSDIGRFHFGEDHLAITLAVVPAGTAIPPPPSVDDIDKLDPVTDAIVDDGTTSTTAVPAPSTTVADTSTTAAGSQ